MSFNTLLLMVPTGMPIPPVVFYVFGAILVVYGILRAKYFGAPRALPGSDDKDDAPKKTSQVRGPTQRRHLRLGIIYILIGLFVLISNYIETH